LTNLDHSSVLATNESLYLSTTSEGLVIAVHGKDMITLSGDYSSFIDCLEAVDGTRTFQEVLDHLTSVGKNPTDVVEILNFCQEENIIRATGYKTLRDDSYMLDPYSYTKWDRQIRNFATLPGITDEEAVSFQAKIEASHIAVLGVGGVGSYVSLSAAMMGIGKLSIIDFDTIELSNTSRQVLYTEESIGRFKVDVAKEQIAKHNPRTKVETFNRKIDTREAFDSTLDDIEKASDGLPDLLFIAADTPRGLIHHLADESCYGRGVPSFNLGPHGFSEVTMGPLIVPGVTPSYEERIPKGLLLQADPSVQIINNRLSPNIMDPYNALIAKMGVIEAVKFLTGYETPAILNSAITINTANWTIERYEYE